MNSGPCNVCVLGYDGDPCDFQSETMPVSRKERKCGECGCTIEKGQKYNRFSGKFDGRMFTEITCLVCREIAEHFSCGHGWTWGYVWEPIRDYLFPKITTGCLEGLSVAAKKKVQDEYRKWKGFKS